MAKPPGSRLKVYGAQFGFHDSVVAAPNQSAALAAWGTRQNLFAEGRAKVVTDPEIVETALAHPGAPLMRAVGAKGAYSLDPGLPEVPAPPRPETAKAAKSASPAKPPDRKPLEAAEARLKSLNDARLKAEADLRSRRVALEAEAADARRRWLEDRKVAEKAVEQARRAFRAAGGQDPP